MCLCVCMDAAFDWHPICMSQDCFLHLLLVWLREQGLEMMASSDIFDWSAPTLTTMDVSTRDSLKCWEVRAREIERKTVRKKNREKESLGPLVGGEAGFKVTPQSYLKLVVLFVQRRCLGSLSLPSSMKSHIHAGALSRSCLTKKYTLTLTQRHTHAHWLQCMKHSVSLQGLGLPWTPRSFPRQSTASD